MEEDTSNDQTQLQKMRGLISRFKPSRRKVRLFSLCLSAIGIIVCIFLFVRAYIYQKHGLRFTYSTEIFISEKLFQGYESLLLIYMSYFLQGISLNSFSIEKYLDTIGKISKFLMIASMFILCPSLWLYFSSITTKFENIGYTAIFVFGIYMTLNIFSFNGQIKENLLQENLMLIGCTLGTLSLFVNNFVSISF
jgi:hypothetical protein